MRPPDVLRRQLVALGQHPVGQHGGQPAVLLALGHVVLEGTGEPLGGHLFVVLLDVVGQIAHQIGEDGHKFAAFALGDRGVGGRFRHRAVERRERSVGRLKWY